MQLLRATSWPMTAPPRPPSTAPAAYYDAPPAYAAPAPTVTYYEPGYAYAAPPAVIVAPGPYYYHGRYWRRRWW